ncbi:MAG TPA: hypothetical protein EYQ00_00530, partial [Dehalococcoidia bacterium]|nr:hypothetical protein [Dehalococcoidia bacterium]
MKQSDPHLKVSPEWFSLTANQQDVLFDHRLVVVPQYNIGGYILIETELDEFRFRTALQVLIARHDALRLEFREISGEPSQRILSVLDPDLTILDFSERDHPLNDAKSWMEADINQSFDVHQAPLCRFALLRVSPVSYCWYFVLHHLISDGLSEHLMMESFAEIYNAQSQGLPIPVVPSYRDVVDLDLTYRASKRFARDENYWLDRFQTIPEALFPRPLLLSKVKSSNASLVLNKARLEKLDSAAEKAGAKPFHFFIALFYLYFARTQQNFDQVLG